ncbi:FHA domain containing protein [Rhodopirellula sallentina SM41]|uniref:FHA domain containing protein n=1 Tax=Rhodopirellula sallentina SM41 TaxID=1263870 RepID=M5U8Q3_9BACT|nr:FHA domain containing protein [Rhodopirellula sallentina SM41]
MTAVDSCIPANKSTHPFRPINRPPVPRLIAVDDDQATDGECFRLRAAETTLGRRDATLLFPCDADMSACHAQIKRELTIDDRYIWRLVDNDSTNGTYVRIATMPLRHDDQIRIGRTQLRWRADTKGKQAQIVVDSEPRRRVPVRTQQSVVIGRDAERVNLSVSDLTVDLAHAKVHFAGGRWVIEDLQSLNGTWRRVSSHELETCDEFILGEQRFRFECPKPPPTISQLGGMTSR